MPNVDQIVEETGPFVWPGQDAEDLVVEKTFPAFDGECKNGGQHVRP